MREGDKKGGRQERKREGREAERRGGRETREREGKAGRGGQRQRSITKAGWVMELIRTQNGEPRDKTKEKNEKTKQKHGERRNKEEEEEGGGVGGRRGALVNSQTAEKINPRSDLSLPRMGEKRPTGNFWTRKWRAREVFGGGETVRAN